MPRVGSSGGSSSGGSSARAPRAPLRRRTTSWRCPLRAGRAAVVAGQAARALGGAGRRLGGARKKVPRFLEEEIAARPTSRGGIARLARRLGRDGGGGARDARRYLREIAARHSPHHLD